MYGPGDYEDEEIPLPPEPAPDPWPNDDPLGYEGPDPYDHDDGGYDHMIENYPEGFREP